MHKDDLGSYCVQVVESQWFGGVKLVCLTHSQPSMKPAWGKSLQLAPMFTCSLPQDPPQPITAFNSYVFQFSPQSTGPTKITTNS